MRPVLRAIAFRLFDLSFAVVAVILVLQPRALAQVADPQMSQCAGEHGETGAQMVAACTALIESGRLDPRQLSRVHAYRALGYEETDDNDRALVDANEAVRLDPTFARGFHRRGDIYKRLRQNDRALADFNEAIRLDPKDPLFFINRSNVYSVTHQYDLAIRDLDEALRLDPSDQREAIVNRCSVLAYKGDLDAALADCQKGRQQHPDDGFVMQTFGFLYFRMGKLDESISAYDASFTDATITGYDKAYSLYGRGVAKLKKGDKAGGEADLAAAKALSKDIALDFE